MGPSVAWGALFASNVVRPVQRRPESPRLPRMLPDRLRAGGSEMLEVRLEIQSFASVSCLGNFGVSGRRVCAVIVVCRIWGPEPPGSRTLCSPPSHSRFHPWTEWVSVGGCSGLCERTRQGEASAICAILQPAWSVWSPGTPATTTSVGTLARDTPRRLLPRTQKCSWWFSAELPPRLDGFWRVSGPLHIRSGVTSMFEVLAWLLCEVLSEEF